MKELVFVKLGGSLITDKSSPFTIRYSEIKRIIKNLREAIDKNTLKLLIGHGGGSFPHTIADIYKTNKGFYGDKSRRGFVLCQNAATTLNRIIVDMMIEYGIDAISIHPSTCCIAKDRKILRFFMEPIEMCIKHDIIPVIYGDCVFDIRRGCTILSTEQLFVYLSKHLKPSRVLVCGLVDGVYTKDPLKSEDAKLLKEIRSINDVETYLKGSYSTDVTGGMLTKVESLLEIANMGIECEILGSNNLYQALCGKRGVGTILLPKMSKGKGHVA